MTSFKLTPMVMAIPVFFLLIGLEIWLSRRRKLNNYPLQDTVTSLNVGIMSQFVNPVGAVVSVVMYGAVQKTYGAFEWDTSHWWTWVSALVLYDFGYYWVHRTGHEVNLFWAAHVVHHNSEEFNLSTALRQASTGFYFKWVFYMPLAVLGYPLQVFIVVGLIDLLYQFWVHTQLINRLGWMEYVFITPSNHRVHHGKNAYCVDRNYGGIFCVWDRLFGTFAEERRDEPVVYGIRSPVQSWNPLWANVHHYVVIWRKMKSMTGWRDKLMCWFASPGWQPQGQVPLTDADLDATKFRSSAPLWSSSLAVVATVLASILLVLFLGSRASMGWPAQGVAVLAAVIAVGLLGAWWSKRNWVSRS